MTLAGDDTINPGLVALNNQTGTQVSATLYASSSFGWTGTRSNHPFIILTNGTERLRIPSDAGGITFPATQVASSDANTLDDYEEGTFTPTLLSGATGISYSTQVGTYTKIGNLVYFKFYLDLSAATPAAAPIQFGGLPFSISGTGAGTGAVISYNQSFNTNNGDTYYIVNGTTRIDVLTNAANGRNGNSGGVTLTGELVLSGFYFV
jgi:hypothetical protein